MLIKPVYIKWQFLQILFHIHRNQPYLNPDLDPGMFEAQRLQMTCCLESACRFLEPWCNVPDPKPSATSEDHKEPKRALYDFNVHSKVAVLDETARILAPHYKSGGQK